MNMQLSSTYESVMKTAAFLDSRILRKPTIGIICGSGLGDLANGIKDPTVLHYSEIPNFPHTSVVGHAGNLVFGQLGNKSVVVMQGRSHQYEGCTTDAIAIPIRALKLLGVDTLLISNAAGGLMSGLKLGDLVILKDHISLPGLSLRNVLVGPNEERFGERFIAMSDAYDARLRERFMSIANKCGYGDITHEGVYAHVGGPTYESPAECRMLKMLGADVVGMSTVPEVVIARHVKMCVFAVSLVTNISVLSEQSCEKADHAEVLRMAKQKTEVLQQLFTELITEI